VILQLVSDSSPTLADPPEYSLRPQYQTRARKQAEAMEKQVADLTTLLQSFKSALEENTAVVRDLSNWKPSIEADVSHLRTEVGKLSTKVDDLVALREVHQHAPKVFDQMPQELGGSSTPPYVNRVAPDGFGHRSAYQNRGDGFGVVTTLSPPPVTGINQLTPESVLPSMVHNMDPLLASYSTHLAASLPQISFPQFDGHHPKMWKAKCESYFEVFKTPSTLWVKLASMHFVGSSAFWWQSVDPGARPPSWRELCSAVCARFERDQHNHLIHQFFHIKQTDSVSEYVDEFDSLMHQILAHDPLFSTSAIINRFVDGLRSDIKTIVFIHRPLDLDTAVSLALLQEELLTPNIMTNSQKSSDQATAKQHNRFQQGVPKQSKQHSDQSKAAALMAYRRAKGLCYKCGLRWSQTHKCSTTVPLHMVEELWQLVSPSDSVDEQQPLQDESNQDLMILSVNAVLGTEALETVKLLATIFAKKVIMLVDSGSSSSFISDRLAKAHPALITLPAPVQVRVANGQVISCTQELPKCKIQIQGHCFHIDLKVLPLNCYDIILGMDWLSSRSPMQIHWQHKWLAFQAEHKNVVLQGIVSDNSTLQPISVP
jgi:hypothetical protein